MVGDAFPRVLAAAQAGDDRAFSVLWHDANPVLVRYLRMLAPEAAEDIAAETWLSVLRGLPRFTGGEAEWRAWLFTTARRRAVDAGRLRQRRPESLVAEVGAQDAGRMADSAEVALENMATRSALATVASLPPAQAEVIMLRVMAGLDTDTVARLVGRSPGAVRLAAHRGLRRLAATLAGGAGVRR